MCQFCYSVHVCDKTDVRFKMEITNQIVIKSNLLAYYIRTGCRLFTLLEVQIYNTLLCSAHMTLLDMGTVQLNDILQVVGMDAIFISTNLHLSWDQITVKVLYRWQVKQVMRS